MKPFFLLGADDPEMKKIQSLLEQHCFPFVHATHKGKRCHPGNAYQADPISVAEEVFHLVIIECEPVNLLHYSKFTRIDHHRPFDPGFHMGSDQYWEASSIGQLHKFFGWDDSHEARVMAAFDHCFPAAVQGRCLGVSGEEVLAMKIKSIVENTGRSEKEVYEKISFFRRAILDATEEKIGSSHVRDLRTHYLGEGYSADLLSAQVAATIENRPVLLRHRDSLSEPEKISISGPVDETTAHAFKEVWGPAQGLVRLYGVPARGYAGGYVK